MCPERYYPWSPITEVSGSTVGGVGFPTGFHGGGHKGEGPVGDGSCFGVLGPRRADPVPENSNPRHKRFRGQEDREERLYFLTFAKDKSDSCETFERLVIGPTQSTRVQSVTRTPSLSHVGPGVPSGSGTHRSSDVPRSGSVSVRDGSPNHKPPQSGSDRGGLPGPTVPPVVGSSGNTGRPDRPSETLLFHRPVKDNGVFSPHLPDRPRATHGWHTVPDTVRGVSQDDRGSSTTSDVSNTHVWGLNSGDSSPLPKDLLHTENSTYVVQDTPTVLPISRAPGARGDLTPRPGTSREVRQAPRGQSTSEERSLFCPYYL